MTAVLVFTLANLLHHATQWLAARGLGVTTEKFFFHAVAPRQKAWRHAVALLTGSPVNLATGMFLIGLMGLHGDLAGGTTVVVTEVPDDSPAAGALVVDDELADIDHTQLLDLSDVPFALEKAAGERVAIWLRREGRTETVYVTPQRNSKGWGLGVGLGEIPRPMALDAITAAKAAWGYPAWVLRSFVRGLGRVWTDGEQEHGDGAPAPAAPSQPWWVHMCLAFAFANVLVGMAHALPLPFTDAGRLLWLFWRPTRDRR